ncbi:MAG: hypothetical protein ACFFDO_10320 [Candidatus Thorarchaeota archaeon]
MAEISKEVKIIFIINIIAGIIYAIQYLILPDILYSGTPYYHPHLSRIYGGTMVILIIGGLIGLKRGELETLKPVWEVVILWFIMVLILAIASLTYMPWTPTDLARVWVGIIVLIILIIINVYFYYKQLE